MSNRRRLPVLAFLGMLLAAAALAASASADSLVNVGSVGRPLLSTQQNEPAIAVDPVHPNVLVAGSNDSIDHALCNAGDDTDCQYTWEVGGSGVYVSQDSGASWTQPTYQGITARHCVGVPGNEDPACVPTWGPIGTVPNYSEHDLVSNGDAVVAFGPARRDGRFSWSYGSRLYYGNLAGLMPGATPAFAGFEAIAVSYTDDVAAAAAGDQSAWSDPVIASKQNSVRFADKPQIWADNAESSPYFGTVYACYNPYQLGGSGNSFPGPLSVLTSRDGGETWKEQQVTPAPYNGHSQQGYGRYPCSIRTTSDGKVYVFVYRYANDGTAYAGGEGAMQMITSDDGGRHWSRPREVLAAHDTCTAFEPSIGRCVIDGIAGARSDIGSGPAVDIANGAPTGADATNQIVMAWADGRDGLNGEDVMLSTSTDRGTSWTPPVRIQQPGDRGFYAASAISPDGTDVYVVYNAFTEPFKDSAEGPENDRPLVGVVQHADVAPDGAIGPFSVLERGASGDARASTQADLGAEFLGDYVGAFATRSSGGGVWNDVRNGEDCPAIDEYRQELHEEAVDVGHAVAESPEPYGAHLAELHGHGAAEEDEEAEGDRPAPQQDCPAGFGNSDIYAGGYADPTP